MTSINTRFALQIQQLNQALMLYQSNDLVPAQQLIETVLLQLPNWVKALNLKAAVAAKLGKGSEAQQCWQRILEIQPEQVDALCNLGYLWLESGDLERAETYLLRGLQQAPEHLSLRHNMAMLCDRQGLPEQAITRFCALLAEHPTYIEGWFNLGIIYEQIQDSDKAFACYRKALALNPLHLQANCKMIFRQYYQIPFDPDRIFAQTVTFGRHCAAQIPVMTHWLVDQQVQRRLRVGFVSGDLRFHVVSFFLAPLLPYLRDLGIDCIAYSNSLQEDELTLAMQKDFLQWRCIHAASDASVAEQIRQDKIDILIDLAGFTLGNRILVFARKPAPVQVSWLGYFGTTGLATMDYVLADASCVPAAEERWFTEKVVRLPDSRLFLFRPEHSADAQVSERGDAQPFTFGCFQYVSKINDEVLRLWAEILQACPQARLRIQSRSLKAPRDLQGFKTRLVAAGIQLDQVQLLGELPYPEYYQACQEVDLILDTFPYPGGTTTNEALWLGVPTLTYAQPGMLRRQGEQLLNAAGIGQWVCRTREDYKHQAIAYGSNTAVRREELRALRQSLPETLSRAPAANPRRFAKGLADVLGEIWQVHCKPD